MAKELVTRHNVSIDEVGGWVCIALHTSALETSSHTANASGLFLIHNSWCAPNGKCKLDNCGKLLNDDITNDVACMRTILQEHKLSEFWGEYEEFNCAEKSRKLIRNCF